MPSKITALTPAPKKTPPNGFDDYGEEEEGEEAEHEGFETADDFAAPMSFAAESEEDEHEGHPAQNDFAAPMNFAAETEEDGHEGYAAPNDFAAPMDFAAADYHDEDEEAEAEAGASRMWSRSAAPSSKASTARKRRRHSGRRWDRGASAPTRPTWCRCPSAPPARTERKAAFTLRLDGDRHLRLRLACAVTGRSAQQIVTGALDSALAAIPEIEALAARVPAKAGSARAKRN